MLVAALRDLQWRHRRVIITVIGTGLVLAMTLVLSGLSASFHDETVHFVSVLGADGFVYPASASGPFTGASPVSTSAATTVAAMPGVSKASPLLLLQAPIKGAAKPQVSLVGVQIGGVGSPTPTRGHGLSRPGQAVVSTSLGRPVGSTVWFGPRRFQVVGTLAVSIYAGTPVVFLAVRDAQAVGLGGARLATSFAVKGMPTDTSRGWASATPDQAVTNLLVPLQSAQDAISFMAILLWIVAGCALASAMYLSAMERSRDFAVFKATGVRTRSLLAGLAIQSVLLSLLSAAVGIVLALILAPRFPLAVVLSPSALVALPVLAVVVGLVASVVGMRRVVSIDPAVAFAGP